MKKLITISLLFLTAFANAQEPAMLWIEGIGGSGYEEIRPVITRTNDGGGIIRLASKSLTGTGNINPCHQTSAEASSIFRKYNGDGILEWEKCYLSTADSGWIYLNPLVDGNFILGGGNGSQFRIRKEDATGNIIWSKNYGGSAGDNIRDIKFTTDGGYIMLGTSNSSDGDVGFHYGGMFNDDIWVLKVDSNGDKLWGTVIGGTSDENARTIVPRADGGYYVFGSTLSTDYDCIGNHGNNDLLVARLDDTGHII